MTPGLLTISISSIILIISIIGMLYIKYRLKQDILGTAMGSLFTFLSILVVIVGILVFPLTLVNHCQYKEFKNYEIARLDNVIIADVENSKLSEESINNVVKFDTYRAVTTFSKDSTKVFLKLEKGIYGNVLYRSIVWSNPPYNVYYER